MDAVTHLAPTVGVVAACDFLGVAHASFYRQRPVLGPPASPAPEPALPAARSAPRERRDQLVHPPYQKPELLATAPNQLWSWDITKLLGPAQWTYIYLYVILDVFSRYVAGWMVVHREGAERAKQFIEETIRKHQVPAGQLNIHADRGRVAASKTAAPSVSSFSTGTTKSIATPASAC